MSSFNERERAFESGFSEDQKNNFRIEARASKLIGYWAADKMGLTGDAKEAYAKDVITANLDEPGYDDVKRKVNGDFAKKNIAVTDAEFDHIITKSVTEATEQLRKQS